MAIFDAMFELSDAQVLTDSSAASTNILDWTQADLEMGAGEPVWLNVRCETAFAGGTSVTVALVQDSTAPVDGSSIVIYQTPALTAIAAGQWILRMPLPYNVDEQQIMGLYYTVAGTWTAGTLNAWLDHGPQSSYDVQVTTSNI
jgi:hypothetical protein